ncbi:MAG: hypothetical protein ACLGIF_00210, partial [Actinomycetes bacterium]
MTPRSPAGDLVRAGAVALTAVAQVASAPLTARLLGPSSNQGAISDAYPTPITPAGYAFSIWGLIYAAALVLAVYQLLPRQRGRTVHRLTGWWLVGAFTASTVWIPLFGARLFELAQLVIFALVGCLAMATVGLRRAGPAPSGVERFLFRL